MDFGSIRRKNRISHSSGRRKTVSSSNLSCLSCSSATVSKKTLYVTVPKDFGCEVNLEGKIVHIRKGSPAHAVGILQIGDFLRVVDDCSDASATNLVKLQITFGVLQVDSRPNCPLVVEIGNRSYTSLGIALADSPDNVIQIASIQPGSLADRCGFLRPGDLLTNIHISATESIPCSPFYNSYQIAQILRQLTSKNTSIKLTIIPSADDDLNDKSSKNSSKEDMSITCGSSELTSPMSGDSETPDNHLFPSNMFHSAKLLRYGKPASLLPLKHQFDKVDELSEDEFNRGDVSVLSVTLWKDPLYEDWGFSLVDECETDVESDAETKRICDDRERRSCRNATVFQIRPGGPAYMAGVKPNDRIIQINGRDVSNLESTMLVPILASLEDSLSLTIVRDSNSTTGCTTQSH